MLGAWQDIMEHGDAPRLSFLLGTLAWAVGATVVGGLFFMSREREFAVRL
jgi:teichoic acid transport system permease protein